MLLHFDARLNLVVLRDTAGEAIDEMPLEVFRRTFGSAAVRFLLRGE